MKGLSKLLCNNKAKHTSVCLVYVKMHTERNILCVIRKRRVRANAGMVSPIGGGGNDHYILTGYVGVRDPVLLEFGNIGRVFFKQHSRAGSRAS